ncbi:unnamed protein product [Schistosoma mattheei]|uniref:Uncharacterized protein n=1 Tax=Schistosoma mattheei TaxID=31246 RepID=A0A183NXL8_9TREM|nr:unnamed protein product [Schistosoma mattheei]
MEKETRKANEHTESGIVSRHEKNEQRLEITGKDCPRQCCIENADGPPMLLEERQHA